MDFNGPASVYIVNTCTVTSTADQKSRKAIRGVKKRNPGALLVATGCCAEDVGKPLAGIGGIDLILGNGMKDKLPELVENAFAVKEIGEKPAADKMVPKEADAEKKSAECGAPRRKPAEEGVLQGLDRTRATLKIQDGCRQFCSYCVIPYVRRELCSMPQEEVLSRVAALEAAGYREVVLLGIHLGAYRAEAGSRGTTGAAAGGTDGLAALLEPLLQSYPGVRFRLGSLEPMEATDELVALIGAYPNACKHLHLPLQSGSDKILRAMKRPYDTSGYRDKVHIIRDMVPDIALTTDVMVGFPGESDEEFRQSLAFANEMAFSRTHVFAYSRRPGTPAADMGGQVAKAVKDVRSAEFVRLGAKMLRAYGDSWTGRSLDVLMESETGSGLWVGRGDNYMEVAFSPPRQNGGFPDDLSGMILPLRIAGRSPDRPGAWRGELEGHAGDE